jgi:hypothetical protein
MDRINRCISSLEIKGHMGKHAFTKGYTILSHTWKAWEVSTLKGGGGLKVCKQSVVLVSQTYNEEQ